jgi:hypothetical protein
MLRIFELASEVERELENPSHQAAKGGVSCRREKDGWN